MSHAVNYTTHEEKYFRVKAFTTSSSGPSRDWQLFDAVHETQICAV